MVPGKDPVAGQSIYCKKFHEKNDACSRACKYYDECITFENFVKNGTYPESRPDQVLESKEREKKVGTLYAYTMH